ncbi:MAG: hypothetical protein ICV64_01230 [Thermoleophilia bacterium]|nr:hypothetical protein [Thermoleophilia bacterium]
MSRRTGAVRAAGSRTTVAATAGAAVVVAAAVVAAVLLLTAGTSPDDEGPRELRVATDFDPRTHLFGDPVAARVHVELDTRRVDPADVRVRARFEPYSVMRRERDVSRAGSLVVLREQFTLQCLIPACTPRGFTLELAPPPVRVDYRLGDGARRTASTPWPSSWVATRIVDADVPSGADPRVPWPWRYPRVPPAVSYRVAPTVAAAVAYGTAALLVLAAALLLAPEVRRLLGVAVRREDPLARLSPPERALALLEGALAAGAPAEQRKALDRLARELRRRGDEDLAGAARRLAWSAATSGDEVRELRVAVARALGART